MLLGGQNNRAENYLDLHTPWYIDTFLKFWGLILLSSSRISEYLSKKKKNAFGSDVWKRK
jgi:hypothetical protein